MEDTNTQTEDTTTNQNSGDTSTVTEGEKLFTQNEVNKVVQKRVKEIKDQFKDYPEIKAQVEQLTEQLKAFKEETKKLEQKYLETTFTSAVDSAAKELNLDTKLATKLLERDKVIFNDNQPTNIKELLQAVIEENPQLVKKQVVTPEVSQTVQTEQPKFSLYTNPNSGNFFRGGGLRLNHVKSTESN